MCSCRCTLIDRYGWWDQSSVNTAWRRRRRHSLWSTQHHAPHCPTAPPAPPPTPPHIPLTSPVTPATIPSLSSPRTIFGWMERTWDGEITWWLQHLQLTWYQRAIRQQFCDLPPGGSGTGAVSVTNTRWRHGMAPGSSHWNKRVVPPQSVGAGNLRIIEYKYCSF